MVSYWLYFNFIDIIILDENFSNFQLIKGISVNKEQLNNVLLFLNTLEIL